MKKKILALALAAVLMAAMAVTAFAAGNGNVAGVIEQTWKSAAQQRGGGRKTVFLRNLKSCVFRRWRGFGYAISLFISSSRGIKPIPSYLMWML